MPKSSCWFTVVLSWAEVATPIDAVIVTCIYCTSTGPHKGHLSPLGGSTVPACNRLSRPTPGVTPNLGLMVFTTPGPLTPDATTTTAFGIDLRPMGHPLCSLPW